MTEPSDADIEALAAEHLKAFAQFTVTGVWVEGEVAFARAVLAKWGTPQPAPAPLSDDVVKDAARYRAFRDCSMDDRNRLEHYSGPALDVAVDRLSAARKQEPDGSLPCGH